MNLADNLKKMRKDHNMSQEELAEKIGVSRQSVSKWESSQAYPEMDKMIQICQLFDVNMDDLLNQDIKDVALKKESHININNFIDSFLAYVTKTIDMFSSMKLKAKIKCLFEQAIIGLTIMVILYVVGIFLEDVFYAFITIFSDSISWRFHNFFRSVYLFVSFVLGSALFLHIFKTRYLDYYEVVKETVEKEKIIDKNLDNIASGFEKEKENIIIRDPKHSGYKFINTLVDIFLIQVKCIVGFLGMLLCLSLVFFTALFICSFLIVNTGLNFIGLALILLAIIIVNVDMLILIYHFILSKSCKMKNIARFFIISLFLGGVGAGLFSIGFLDFEYVTFENSKYFTTVEEKLTYEDGMFIDYYDEYVETDSDEIKIEIKYGKAYDSIKLDHDQMYYFFVYQHNYNELNMIKEGINSFKNKELVNFDATIVTIYTSEETIEKMNDNRDKYYNRQAYRSY